MRSLAILATLSLFAAGAAAAQPAPVGPPKAFQPAYSQPDITPGLCRSVSPKETQCTIPAMTAGRYAIEAQGTSTATAAGALQAIDIRLADSVCASHQSAADQPPKPWSSGPQTIKVICVVQLLADNPVLVRATYADAKATPDPKGPVLSFRRLPWSPIISSIGGVPQQ